MKNLIRLLVLWSLVPAAYAQTPSAWTGLVRHFDAYVATDKIVGRASSICGTGR
jgi:hypothetical protein